MTASQRPHNCSQSLRGIMPMALALALVLSACSRTAPPSQKGLAPGDYTFTIDSQGLERTYRLHLPPQAASGDPLPVILNFHGGGGNAEGQQRYAQMDTLADEKGFFVVYPNGTGRLEDRLLTWNVGRCCGYAQEQDIDDVGFVLSLLDDLATRTAADMQRVYATGLSNGAMMSYRLAAEIPDRIAAIAPVAAALAPDPIPAGRPMPIMHIHSVDDPRALYDGGLGPPFPLTTRRVLHQSVEEVLSAWAEHDGCPLQPIVAEVLTAEPGSDDEGQSAEKLVYRPCASGAEIVHWRLHRAGHVWPGGERDYLQRLLGPSTGIIDANREMWEFFSQYSLPDLPNAELTTE